MLNAAIIGLGRWGQILVESVQGKSDKITFTRGVTRTPSKATDFAAKHGFPLGDDYDAALSDSNVQAIVLATPHGQHAEQMARAAAAGKHLFVEKPFTLTKASAEQSIAAVRKAGLVVSAGHNRRFLPSIAELQRRIETGALGQTLHAEATFSGNSGLVSKPGMWRAGLADNPAGGMTAMGIHMVDTLIDLFGSIDEVYAQSFRQAVDIEIDDTTSILLRFENGKSAYLGTFNATGRIWSLRVFGTKGWLEIRHQSELIFRNLEGEEEVVDFGDTDIERAELEAFADTVANGADYPVSDAEAIHGVAVLEAIAASAAQHEPVKVA